MFGGNVPIDFKSDALNVFVMEVIPVPFTAFPPLLCDSFPLNICGVVLNLLFLERKNKNIITVDAGNPSAHTTREAIWGDHKCLKIIFVKFKFLRRT